MKITIVYAVLLLTILISRFTFAAENPSFSVSPVVDKALVGDTLLRLVVQDVQAKSGVCFYYLKQLQYLPTVKALILDIYHENCVNDAFGISKGEVDWVVPSSLLTDGEEVHVWVNQTKTGSLVYDAGTKNFHVKN